MNLSVFCKVYFFGNKLIYDLVELFRNCTGIIYPGSESSWLDEFDHVMSRLNFTNKLLGSRFRSFVGSLITFVRFYSLLLTILLFSPHNNLYIILHKCYFYQTFLVIIVVLLLHSFIFFYCFLHSISLNNMRMNNLSSKLF